MLRRLALRRCLHTPPPRPQARYNSSHLRFTLGVSVITATYLTWRLTSDSHYIALDSPENISSLKQPSPLSKPTLSNPSHPKVLSPDSTPPPLNHDPEYEKKPPSEPDSEGSREGLDDTTKADAEGESPDEGAFNPVTGEINWDCPCLGGMAHGPCGVEFREAFSCFVYSEDEPKGINCVEKFKGMQDCFRAHPDLYGEEIMDEDDDDESATLDRGQGDKDDVVPLSTNSETDEKKNVDPDPPTNQPPKRKSKPQAKTSQAALSFQSESSAQPPSSPVPSL